MKTSRNLWLCLLGSMMLVALIQPVYGSGAINSVEDVPPEIVEWIQTQAVPFETTHPREDNSDLEAVRDLVGDAQVVSLGEATHGTAEFFWMKDRILRYLVEEMGFRFFMIEANYAESLAMNNYVLHGEGNPNAALSGMYFWTWNTQEVLDMVEWMREYNIEHPNDPVQFIGFDAQFHAGGTNVLYDYLRVVDSERASEIYGSLQCFDDGSDARTSTPLPECQQTLQDLRQEFSAKREMYSAASSESEYLLMGRVVETLIQVEQLYRERLSNWRDEAMAQNIIWLTEVYAPDSKVVLWAHNAHVQTAPIGMGEDDFQFRPMGIHLREHYGDDMVVMGFAFWDGSFRAYEANDNGIYGELTSLQVLPPVSDSHEFFLQAAGIPNYFLDVRDVDSEVAAAWLDQDYNLRVIGAVYNTESGAGSYTPTHLPDAFDVMIFVEESTPTEKLFHDYGLD